MVGLKSEIEILHRRERGEEREMEMQRERGREGEGMTERDRTRIRELRRTDNCASYPFSGVHCSTNKWPLCSTILN